MAGELGGSTARGDGESDLVRTSPEQKVAQATDLYNRIMPGILERSTMPDYRLGTQGTAGSPNYRLDSFGPQAIFADSSTRALSENDLQSKSAKELWLGRNEIFARHGYVFQNPELKQRFETQLGYRPNPNFKESDLSPVEKSNVALIRAREAAVSNPTPFSPGFRTPPIIPLDDKSAQLPRERPKGQDIPPLFPRETDKTTIKDKPSEIARLLERMPGTRDSDQLVLVTSPQWGSTTGSLRRFERRGDSWSEVGTSMPVNVGRNGMSWGEGLTSTPGGRHKAEGDGTAPAGVFSLDYAFGKEESARTGLPYQTMRPHHKFGDDPRDPQHYNKLFDARTAPGARGETMRRPDGLYDLGIVVGHNPDRNPGDGSAIFMHIGGGRGTAGCTSMSRADMSEVAAWLKQSAKPVLVQAPTSELATMLEMRQTRRR